MYDLIGDIHGYADALESILKKLGYSFEQNAYRHPERKVIFLGDYIDRGPKIRETLQLVRNMVDAGQAIALMGNHEYNAIGYNTENSKSGEYLRPRTEQNIKQHAQTLEAFRNHEAEYHSFVNWFMELPLFYENDSFRTVHACWDHHNIDLLKKELKHGCLTESLLHQSHDKTEFADAVNETIKGKEVKLPNGQSFEDFLGHERTEMRYKWWEPVENATYKTLCIDQGKGIPDELIHHSLIKSRNHYPPDEKPVFFGHYWLTGEPFLYRNNICCLDFSVARAGHLVAYSYNGEDRLNPAFLKNVPANP